MREAFYIFLGALITTGFNILTEYIREKYNKKIHLYEKREEIYLRMLSILYLLKNEALDSKNQEISQKRKKEIEECYPSINVYASDAVKNLYNITAKQIDLFFMNSRQDTQPLEKSQSTIEDFIKLIRHELGVKN